MTSDEEETLFATKIDNKAEEGSIIDLTHLARTVAQKVPDINILEQVTIRDAHRVTNDDMNVPDMAFLDLMETAETALVENGGLSDWASEAVDEDQGQNGESRTYLSEHVRNNKKRCQEYKGGGLLGVTNNVLRDDQLASVQSGVKTQDANSSLETMKPLNNAIKHCMESSDQSLSHLKRKRLGAERTKMLLMHDGSSRDKNDAAPVSAQNSVPCVPIENMTTFPDMKTRACAMKTSENNSIKYAIPMYLIVNREDLNQNLNLADFSKGVTANVNVPMNKIVNNNASGMSSKLENSTLTTSLNCKIVPIMTNVGNNVTLQRKHSIALPKCSKSMPIFAKALTEASSTVPIHEHEEDIEIPSSSEQIAKKVGEKHSCTQNTETCLKSIDISTVPERLQDEPEKSSSFDSESIPKSKKNSGKRAKAVKKLASLKFPPCTVCGGDASGIHYGCNTCEACKNFFLRCLIKKNGVNYFCSQGQNCEISFKNNKNNCSACRYKKCLDLGMSKDKCKKGRYTYSKRTETINQVRKLEGKDMFDSSSCSSGSASNSASMSVENSPQSLNGVSGESSRQSTSDDPIDLCIRKHISDPADSLSLEGMNNKELVEHLLRAAAQIMSYMPSPEIIKEKCRECHLDYNRKVSLFGSLTNVSMEEYRKLLKDYGIDMGNMWEKFKKIVNECDPLIACYCKFAQQIPEFLNLSLDDQSTLLKTTNPSFFLIIMHQGYRSEYNVVMEIDGQPFHVDEAADKFYSRSFIEYNCKLMAYIQTLHLTSEEVALLGTIATMAGDQCVLQNHKLVDRVQEHLTNVLHQELVKNYGQIHGLKRFTKCIDLLISLKEYCIHYQKEFKEMCDDPMVKGEFQNIESWLPDDV